MAGWAHDQPMRLFFITALVAVLVGVPAAIGARPVASSGVIAKRALTNAQALVTVDLHSNPGDTPRSITPKVLHDMHAFAIALANPSLNLSASARSSLVAQIQIMGVGACVGAPGNYLACVQQVASALGKGALPA